MKMMLKIAIACETEAANDTHDCRRIGAQSLCQSAHAQQYILARVLKDGADDFLTFNAQLLDPFRQSAAQLAREAWISLRQRINQIYRSVNTESDH